MQLITFGPPGVGKGTQSAMLAKKYSIPHISTGDIFRAEIKAGNPELVKYVEKGLLVPDSVVNSIVEKRITEKDCKKGFILDGYPRTVEQAKFLEDVMGKLKMRIDAVINYCAPQKEIIKRLSSRRMCGKCGAGFNVLTLPPKTDGKCDRCNSDLVQRKDDQPETVKKRIEVYEKETSPVMGYYRKKKLLVDIDATPNPESVFNDAVKAISKFSPK